MKIPCCNRYYDVIEDKKTFCLKCGKEVKFKINGFPTSYKAKTDSKNYNIK